MTSKTLTSMMLLLCAGAAHAQDAGQQAPSKVAQRQASDHTIVGLDEVVVTAQRRSERLVDVPISIATATSEDLERSGPTSIENLTKVTPGVYIQRAVYGLSPTIRGIGSTLAASGGQQNVVLYVDEIYYPTPTGNVFDLASVAGVEILKGPQGTLFGRNATGGAILLRTFDPDLSEASGKVNLSWERFNQYRASAYLNAPLSDKVAVNGSVAYRYSEGYTRDLRTNEITNQGDNLTLRGKLLFQPTDNLSVVLVAAHSELDDPTGANWQSLQPAALVALLGGPIATDRFDTSKDLQEVIQTETDELSARAKLELDAGTISSFTSYLNNKLDALNDLEGSYIPQDVALAVRTKTFQQEVNFASREDQPFTYVTGIYYYRGKSNVPFLTSNGAPVFSTRGDSRAIAVYADGSYKFGNLSLIAGLRYTHEKRDSKTAFGASSIYTRFQRATDKLWTPRIGLKYELNEQSNVYATYSRGFKSGVFDSTSLAGPSIKPEIVDAFEVGYKRSSQNLTFNAAAYYYDYKDTQVNATVSGESGQIFNQLFNAPKSEIYGAEFDVSYRVNENFDLRVAAAYTHAHYKDFPFAPSYVLNPADPATLGGLIYSNTVADVAGNHMVRAPDFTASATVRYHTPIGDNDELEITLSPYYSSRVYMSFDNRFSQKPYVTLDGAVTLTLQGRTTVSIYGRNLTDTKYKTAIGQNALGLQNTVFATPRVFGLALGYSF